MLRLLTSGLFIKGWGKEYKGIVELIVENPVADLLNDWSEQEILNKNIEINYPVEVIYDGETYSWEIITD